MRTQWPYLNLLDDIFNDAFTEFGVMSDGLDVTSGSVWAFEKCWSSEYWTILRPRRIDVCMCVLVEGLEGGGLGGFETLERTQSSGTAIFSPSSTYIWTQK